jgi:hypothetical protein
MANKKTTILSTALAAKEFALRDALEKAEATHKQFCEEFTEERSQQALFRRESALEDVKVARAALEQHQARVAELKADARTPQLEAELEEAILGAEETSWLAELAKLQPEIEAQKKAAADMWTKIRAVNAQRNGHIGRMQELAIELGVELPSSNGSRRNVGGSDAIGVIRTALRRRFTEEEQRHLGNYLTW